MIKIKKELVYSL